MLEDRRLLTAVSSNRLEEVLEQYSPQDLTSGVTSAISGTSDMIDAAASGIENIPLLGDEIVNAFSPILDQLGQLDTVVETGIQQAFDAAGIDESQSLLDQFEGGLFRVLGPSGLNLLQDYSDADLDVNQTDIVRTAGIDVDVFGSQIEGSEWLQWNMKLGQQFSFDIPVGHEIDLETLTGSSLFSGTGFSVTTEGELRVTVDWTAHLGFGVTLGNDYDPLVHAGFYIDAAAGEDQGVDEEFRFSLSLSGAPKKDAFGQELPGTSSLSGSASLGLVSGMISDGTIHPETLQPESTVITATMTVDVRDPSAFPTTGVPDHLKENQLFLKRLTERELAQKKQDKQLYKVLTPELEVDAEIRLHLDTETHELPGYSSQSAGIVPGSLGIPEVELDLNIDASGRYFFPRVSGSPVAPALKTGQVTHLSLANVVLDVRPLLDGILRPTANLMSTTMSPLTSMFGPGGFWNRPIPVLDVIGPAMGFGQPSLASLSPSNPLGTFVQNLGSIQGQIDSLISSLPQRISFGSYIYNLDQVSPALNHIDHVVPNSQRAIEVIATIEGALSPIGYRLDIAYATEILDMLLGRRFEIVSYNIPAPPDVNFGAGFGFDFRALSFNMGLNASVDFNGVRVAYDSAGLESIVGALKAGARPDFRDLLDGFYVRSGDILNLSLNMSGGGGVDTWVFFADGSAGLGGNINLGLKDPNGDGSLRLNEIMDATGNLSNPQNIIHLFNANASLNGHFDVRAGGRYITVGGTPPRPKVASYSIGLGDIGLPNSFSVGLSLSDVLGYSVASTGPEATQPILATHTTENGESVLRVNAGVFARDRVVGSTNDAGGISVTGQNGSIIVTMNGVTQSYAQTQRVLIVGTEADDIINFSNLNVPVEVRSLGGNDTIHTGHGDDLIDAGDGNDVIYSGGGNDRVNAGSGNDTVYAGAGHDTVQGGRGNDLLLGETGNDELHGEFGDDSLFPGTGNDTVDGGSGDDQITSVSGLDQLDGSSGADVFTVDQVSQVVLDGGSGYDEIHINAPSSGPGNDAILDAQLTASQLTMNGLTSTYNDVDQLTFHTGTDADTIEILSTSSIVSVDAVSGNSTKDSVIIDLSAATEDLSGTIEASRTTGFGLHEVNWTGVENLGVTLGAGDDEATVNGTVPDSTIVEAGPGEDSVTVVEISGPATINGGQEYDKVLLQMPENPLGFGDLGVGVEELIVDHSAATTSVDWTHQGGSVYAGTDLQNPIVDALGADLVTFIGGNGTDDSLAVSNQVPNPQRISIERDRVRIEEGLDLLSQQPGSENSFSFADMNRTADGLAGTSGTDTSPDGEYIYVAGDSSVSVYRRTINNGTGAVEYEPEFVQRIRSVAADPSNGVHGLLGARDVVVSPDGRNVYVTSPHDLGIAIFERVELTGRLIYSGFLVTSVPMERMDMSGNSDLYASSGGLLIRYGRNAADGSLAYVHHAPLPGQINDVAVTPNGTSVYAVTDAGLYINDPNTISAHLIDNQEAPYYSVTATNGAVFAGTRHSIRRYDRNNGHSATRFETGNTAVSAIDTGLSQNVAAGLNTLSTPVAPEPALGQVGVITINPIKPEETIVDQLLVRFQSPLGTVEFITGAYQGVPLHVTLPAGFQSQPWWTMSLLENDPGWNRELGQLLFNAGTTAFHVVHNLHDGVNYQTFIHDGRLNLYTSANRVADIIGAEFSGAPQTNFHYQISYNISRTDPNQVPDELLMFNQGLGLLTTSDIANRVPQLPDMGPVLTPGTFLHRGQSIYSANGAIRLSLQHDGNLAIWSGPRLIWHAATNAGEVLAMQHDGNLVLYGQHGPVWNSGPVGPGAYAVMQDDGNLVIRDAGHVYRWGTVLNALGNYELRTNIEDISITPDNVTYALNSTHSTLEYQNNGHVRQGEAQQQRRRNRGDAHTATLVREGKAYSVSAATSTLVVTDTDPASVATPVQIEIPGLLHASDPVVTADGHLLVTNPTEDAVLVFDLAGDGTVIGGPRWMRDGVNGVQGLDAVSSLAAHGNQLLALSPVDNTLTLLDPVGDTWQAAVSIATDLDGPTHVTVSDDGSQIYVASRNNDSVVVFGLNGSTLQHLHTYTHAVNGISGLASPLQTLLSHDERFLYLAGAENTVTVFERDAASGALTLVQSLRNGSGGIQGLRGIADLAFSADEDGQYLFAAGADDDTIVVFARNAGNGRLSFVQRIKNNSGGVTGISNPTSLNVVGDRVLVSTGGDGHEYFVPIGASHDADSVLTAGEGLYAGDAIVSPNGAIRFELQDADRNLVVRRATAPTWAGGVQGQSGHVLRMQVDGNLVLYRADNSVVWHSHTHGNPGARAVLRDDGNLIIVSADDRLLWTANAHRYAVSAQNIGITELQIDTTAPDPQAWSTHYEGVESLAVASAAGGDQISIRETVIDTTVDSGAGNDDVVIHDAPADLTTEVNLGAGSDSAVLRQAGDGATVTINGDNGNDELKVVSTGTGVTQLLGGGDADEFIIDGTTLGTTLFVEGGQGSDVLTFDTKGGTRIPAHNEGQTDLSNNYPSNGTLGLTGQPFVDYEEISEVDLIAAPDADAGGHYQIAEGDSLTLAGGDSAGNVTGISFEWDLNGDGVFGDATGATTTISWEQLYSLGLTDDGQYQVALRATNNEGSDEGTASLSITNTAPVIDLTADSLATQYVSWSLDIASIDPGEDTVTGYEVDWGDGQASVLSETFGQLTHVYTDTGRHQVIVRTSDEDGGPWQQTFDVDVLPGPAPTRTLSGATTSDEGSAWALTLQSGGPGIVTQWRVDWGDGTESVLAAASGSLQHTYADDGVYHVTASVTDEKGAQQLADNSLSVSVDNVAPTITFTGGSSAVEGGSYQISGFAATDPGADTISGWIVDWGDGNVSSIAAGSTSASHSWADDGSYVVQLGAVDEDGTFVSSQQLTVTVNNVAPVLSATGDSSVNEGQPYNLQLTATDPGNDAISEWTIDWGDGSAPQVVDGSVTEIEHTYADGLSTPVISVSAQDEDGSYTVAPLQITVLDVAPDPVIDTAAQFDEVQNVRIQNAGGGILRLEYDGEQTEDILLHATEEDIQLALEELTSIGSGNVAVRRLTGQVDEVQQVSLINADGGTFTLSLDGDTTAPISFDAEAADVQAALEQLPAVGSDNVTVSRVESDLLVFFQGSLAGRQMSQLLVDGSSLVDGIQPAIAEVETQTDGGPTVDIQLTFRNDLAGVDAELFSIDASGLTGAPSVEVTTQVEGGVATTEGAEVTILLSSEDPGTDPITQWEVDWGDGSAVEILSGTADSASHTYSDDGNYQVSAVLVSPDGRFNSNSLDTRVSNVAPVVDLAGTWTRQQADPVQLIPSSVVDPGDDTVSEYQITWGDGSSFNGRPWQTFSAGSSLQHTFSDGIAVHTPSVTVVDEDGTYASVAVIVVTHDVTLDAVRDEAFVGTLISDDPLKVMDALTFEVTGDGADDALFRVSNEGVLSFLTPPDPNTPADADGNNRYEVEIDVTGTDGPARRVSVLVRGANVPSVIGGDFSGSVTEGDVGDDAQTASGTVSISDADPDDSPSFADVSETVSDLGFGSFNLQNSQWTYTLNQAAVQSLDAGQTVEDGMTVVASDGNSQEITITITGTDDESVVTGDSTGDVIEGDPGDDVSTTGDLQISDVDSSDDPEFEDVASIQGGNALGEFSLTNGVWKYTSDQQAIQQLAANSTAADSATFTATDGTEQTIDITIHGRNDVPTVDGNVEAVASEDAAAFIVNLLDGAADVDTGDTLSVADLTRVSGDDGGITINGSQLNVDPSAYNWLAAGESAVIVYEYNVRDSAGAEVARTARVTVTGVNDDPAAGAVGATVESDTVVLVSADFSDPDTSDTHTLTVDTTLTAGLVTNHNDGTFTYDPNGAFDHLNNGDEATDTFVYTVDDGNGGTSSATVTITIRRCNETPVIEKLRSSSRNLNHASQDGIVSVSGRFSDGNAQDLHTVVVDWGDGTAPTAAVVNQNKDRFKAEHQYATGGIFTVTVTLDDGYGGVVTQSAVAVVEGVGLVNGTLFLIGTERRDHVRVRPRGNDLHVHAVLGLGSRHRRFIHESFPESDVDRVVAFLRDGHDSFHGAGISVPQIVFAGSGADRVAGGDAADLIHGGEGRDLLIGRDGDDILIGGDGSDLVFGGHGRDLLIGGRTRLARNPFELLTDVDTAMQEWANGDLQATLDALSPRRNDGHRDWLFGDDEEDEFLWS